MDFLCENDSLGCPDPESGGCHFGTLEHFFFIHDFGVNKGKNRVNGGTI